MAVAILRKLLPDLKAVQVDSESEHTIRLVISMPGRPAELPGAPGLQLPPIVPVPSLPSLASLPSRTLPSRTLDSGGALIPDASRSPVLRDPGEPNSGQSGQNARSAKRKPAKPVEPAKPVRSELAKLLKQPKPAKLLTPAKLAYLSKTGHLPFAAYAPSALTRLNLSGQADARQHNKGRPKRGSGTPEVEGGGGGKNEAPDVPD